MKCKCGRKLYAKEKCKSCYRREQQKKWRERNPSYYKKMMKDKRYIERSSAVMRELFG